MQNTLIAIVEDDQDDQEFISTSLYRNSTGCEVKTFSGGQSFFSFISAAERLPDLIITDLRMPLVSGFDVIRFVKNHPKTKDIKIVVLSTSSSDEDIKKAKNLGAQAYYVKPHSLKEYAQIADQIISNLNENLLSFSMAIAEFIRSRLGTGLSLLIPESGK